MMNWSIRLFSRVLASRHVRIASQVSSCRLAGAACAGTRGRVQGPETGGTVSVETRIQSARDGCFSSGISHDPDGDEPGPLSECGENVDEQLEKGPTTAWRGPVP